MRIPRTALSSVLALGLLPGVLSAQPPSVRTLADFEPNGEYAVHVNGQVDPAAETYRAGRIPAFLVVSKALGASVVLLPGEKTAWVVPDAAIHRRDGGVLDVELNASAQAAAEVVVGADDASFRVPGKKGELLPKPPLEGLHTGADIERYNVTFAFRAGTYAADPAAIEALRGVRKPVTVHVLFGSWCPHCQRVLPAMLRTERILAGSPLRFEYFGLPAPPATWTHEEVKRYGINAVPFAAVLVDGVEVGRLPSTAWAHPEVILANVLRTAGVLGN